MGVVVLAANSATLGTGYALRRWLVCGAVGLHGLRMATGALVLFFPYTFKHGDLSRYQYAQKRWLAQTHSPGLWWLKQQHDTAMQAFANSVGLAGPIILAATNPRPSLHVLEIVGLACWLMFWVLESLADVQKLAFLQASKKNGDAHTAVLGHAPYDTDRYWMWVASRHPNYFCEWMCWNAFVLAAVPSVLDLWADSAQPAAARFGVCVLLAYTSRSFYDCLVHWTGAAPAEARSVKRRPAYRAYQQMTNVLVPWVAVPGFDHHRQPGWPLETAKVSQ